MLLLLLLFVNSAWGCQPGSVIHSGTCQKCPPGTFYQQQSHLPVQITGSNPLGATDRCATGCDQHPCQSGLVCFQRDHGEPVPGCTLSHNVTVGGNEDVCIQPTPVELTIASFLYENVCHLPNDVDGVCYTYAGLYEHSRCGSDGWAPGSGYVEFNESMTSSSTCIDACSMAVKDGVLGDFAIGSNFHTASYKNGECRCNMISLFNYCLSNSVIDNQYTLLVIETIARHRLLHQCEGSCRSNSDCGGELSCHIRMGDEYTPSCDNTAIASGTNICYDPYVELFECTDCPVMTYQPVEGTSACLTCLDGTFTQDYGRTTCDTCPAEAPCCAGYGYVNGTCTQCQAGLFSYGGTEICRMCGEGSVAVQHKVHSYGTTIYFQKNASNACHACPEGTKVEQHICTPCPSGTYELEHECPSCPPGSFSNAEKSTQCESCQHGFFMDESGSTACTPCSHNSYTLLTGANACIQCPSGKKSPMASNQCYDACPPETFDSGNTCEYCLPGKYFSDGACTDCPTGYVKSMPYEPDCQPCLQKIPNNDKTNCDACLPGKYYSSGSCTECGQGTYGPSQVVNESLLYCSNCPQGYAQPSTGQTACVACVAGTYSMTEIACFECPAGQVAPYQEAHACQTCPSGTGAMNSTGCQSCTAGTGTSHGQCVACEIGKYSSIGACEVCPSGRYTNETGSTTCHRCAAGFYSANTSYCGVCNESAHEYTNLFGPGSTHCIECSDTSVACQVCSPGTYSSGNQCDACAPGRVNNGNRFCTECSTFQIPNDEQSDCVSCDPGFEKQGDVCVSCPIGKFGTQSQCLDCPKGQFSSEVNTVLCQTCDSDMTTASTASTMAIDCTSCQQLGYGPTMVVIHAECTDCLPGHVFSPAENNCIQCPNGQHRSATQIECQPCTVGTFSDQGEPCQECPTGYFSVQPGQSQCELCLAQCDECAAGYKRVNNECVACSPGSFSLLGQTQCQLCGLGQYQPSSGASNCIACSTGQYQNTHGQSTCKQCLAGFYQEMHGQGACHACTVGQYAEEMASTQCVACPSGMRTVQNQAQSLSECVACPAGSKAVSGMCLPCSEGYFQDEEGRTACKSCPQGHISSVGATASNQCFSLDGMQTYVFGMRPDSKSVQKYDKTCEIRPNSMLLCPSCSCDSDSRNGFWASPVCDECQRGFATRTCKVGCAGYNGVSDATMCHGKGKCWYGKFGNGLCYCGGRSEIDSSSESVVVDVRLCPKGQICPNYGEEEQTETVYRPIYYMILYRQYSTFVLKLNEYTPDRGHMWFGRFSPGAAYENGCQACTGTYQQNALTSIGYWSKDGTYRYFDDAKQTQNGFHGENCQYECAACLHGGTCNTVPHPFRYTYTIVDTYRPQRSVTLPTTYCRCRGGMDPEHMCCPNGFQPYVYHGVRDSVPYSRFTKMPFISSVVNTRMDYHIRSDIYLEPNYDTKYAEPLSGMQWQANSEDQFVALDFSETGAYNMHPYYGSARDICRPCPGLFGQGVRSQSIRIESAAVAVDFWWDNTVGASSRKCNGVGVCDFYAKERELDVHFMGNADSFFKEKSARLCNASQTVYTTFQDSENIDRPIVDIQQCAQRSKQSGDVSFAFAESYLGGSADVMHPTTQTHKFYAEQYAATMGSLGVASLHEQAGIVWFALSPNVTSLPFPNANSPYEIYAVGAPRCIGFETCPFFITRPGYSTYKHTPGRARDRSETATYDRFDTCFTYNWEKKVSVLGLYSTKEYTQGEDPFLGGLCPAGHFCSMHDKVGYKEECPAGYFQPDEGRTRTRSDVQCVSKTHLVDGCQPKTSTHNEHDYVDQVCQRCGRSAWAPAGSSTCTECPVGRVKKISGVFDTSTQMINIPTSISRYRSWYYQENEQGVLQEDCALIPSSMVHVTEASALMSYDRPSFLPIITCPYGYSTRPGAYLHAGGSDFAYMIANKLPNALIQPPFMYMELSYSATGFGETCNLVDLNEIDTLQSCRTAAESLGIANVQQRPGIFEGCWYMPSIDPTTAFWGVGGTKKCVRSLQYLCQRGNGIDNIWSDFVQNTCFRCPGTSVSGPESGTCGTCPGNTVKEYMKESIQKIAEGGVLEMVDKDGTDVLLEPNVILNMKLQEITCSHESPSFVLTPKFSGKTTLADCYIACQSLATQQAPDYLIFEGAAKTNFLRAIKVDESFPFKCSCATGEDFRSNCSASSSSGWQDIEWRDWDVAQPFCSSCEPGKFTKVTNGMAHKAQEALFRYVCVLCPAGFYTSSSVESNTGECLKCQPGHFQSETGQSQCDKCPSGFYQLFEAQTTCNGCSAGQFQSLSGMSFCLNCPLGYLQPLTGQFECTTCPAGFYMVDTQLMECLSCLPGQYQDVGGSTTCKSCLPGTFSAVHNMSQACLPCMAGKYQSQSGQTECTSCTWGTYKEEAGSNTICADCPNGWYAEYVGQGECEPCPGGYPCDQTHVSNSDAYFKCPSGTYLPPLVWGSTCLVCAAEYFANENATTCLECPAGTTTNGLARQECIACPEEGWNGIRAWNGMEYQTQNWNIVTRTTSKPSYGLLESGDSGECKQACASNSDCGDGLKCFRRSQLEPVPGCSTSSPNYGENICYMGYETSKLHKNVGSVLQELGECQGHCASNADCAPGLFCHVRNTGESTPGCYGPIEYNANVCYDPSGARKMSQGYQYASASLGRCLDSQYLPEGAFPLLLSPSRRLYDTDRSQECMNRCLDAYPGTGGFYTRISDGACACASGVCDQRSSENDYQSFLIFETDRFVETFSTYVVALSNGTRDVDLYNADDTARVSLWQSQLAAGSSQASALSSAVTQQSWHKGQMGRIQVQCENQQDLYNCHFKISKDNDFPEFKFYKEDPGSNYCALHE